MRYDDFVRTVLQSSPSDWRPLTGPVPYQYLGEAHIGERHWLELSEHHSLWVFAENIRITMAYGMEWPVRGQELTFPELPKWPDHRIFGRYVDLLYNGNPIKRVELIMVDGGRAILPTPNNEIAPSGAPFGMEVFAYTAPASDVALARLVDQLLGHREFERYFSESGIVTLSD